MIPAVTSLRDLDTVPGDVLAELLAETLREPCDGDGLWNADASAAEDGQDG